MDLSPSPWRGPASPVADPLARPVASSVGGPAAGADRRRWRRAGAPALPANDDGWPVTVTAAARVLGLDGQPTAQSRALDAFLAGDDDGWRWWRLVADRLEAHHRIAARPARG